MKRLALIAVLASTTGLLAQGQQTAPPPSQTPPAQGAPDEKDKPKTDAKVAPVLAGKWNLSVETQQGANTSVLDLKIDGKKLTGTVSSQMGELPISGEFADGKISFDMAFQGSNGSMQITFTGAFKDENTLTGTMDIASQGMQLPWKAERVK